MTLLDRLEFRFGRYAIHGLIRYVVAISSVFFVLGKLNPAFVDAFDLYPDRVMQGQVWRLVTYVFIPRFGPGLLLPEWFNAAMYMLFLWWVGSGLEQALGAFKLNVYYLTGLIGVTVAAFFTDSSFATFILNASLLFAFAQFYPDQVIYIMYILPAKVKWLAWIAAGMLGFTFLSETWAYRAVLIVALANYFLFFGPEIYRGAKMRQQVAERRRKFEVAKAPDSETLHECVVCHRTEASHPDLDFRVSRDGEEYCRDHLPKPAGPAPATS